MIVHGIVGGEEREQEIREKENQQEIFAAIIKFATIKSFFCFMRFNSPLKT